MRTRIAPILWLAMATGVSAQNGVSPQRALQVAPQTASQVEPQPAPTTAQTPKADLIFTHGNIYTGVVDAAVPLGGTPRAEALAVRGDRILAVGARDEIMKL